MPIYDCACPVFQVPSVWTSAIPTCAGARLASLGGTVRTTWMTAPPPHVQMGAPAGMVSMTSPVPAHLVTPAGTVVPPSAGVSTHPATTEAPATRGANATCVSVPRAMVAPTASSCSLSHHRAPWWWTSLTGTWRARAGPSPGWPCVPG